MGFLYSKESMYTNHPDAEKLLYSTAVVLGDPWKFKRVTGPQNRTIGNVRFYLTDPPPKTGPGGLKFSAVFCGLNCYLIQLFC